MQVVDERTVEVPQLQIVQNPLRLQRIQGTQINESLGNALVCQVKLAGIVQINKI